MLQIGVFEDQLDLMEKGHKISFSIGDHGDFENIIKTFTTLAANALGAEKKYIRLNYWNEEGYKAF
jgi:hypothetical protein